MHLADLSTDRPNLRSIQYIDSYLSDPLRVNTTFQERISRSGLSYYILGVNLNPKLLEPDLSRTLIRSETAILKPLNSAHPCIDPVLHLARWMADCSIPVEQPLLTPIRSAGPRSGAG
jgi:hypothetical protein